MGSGWRCSSTARRASVVALLASGARVGGLGRDGARDVSFIAANTSGIARRWAVLLQLGWRICPRGGEEEAEGAVAVHC